MFKREKDLFGILEKALREIEALNYSEQFLDIFPGFVARNFPVQRLAVFVLDKDETEFIPYWEEGKTYPALAPITADANLIIYLKNNPKSIVLRDESPPRLRFLEKTNSDLFKCIQVDMVVPLCCTKKLYGFAVLEANSKTYKELDYINGFFKIFSNILMPLIAAERIEVENSRNYYKIYRMDRLAMVGELAASAAHEIKNPLAGISTFLKYFTELEDFNKNDIIEELKIMKDSVRRIDEIVKSLLSFSRFKTKEISKMSLASAITASLQSIGLKIPANITMVKKINEEFMVETDSHQLQQVLVNILFNAIDAIDKKEGEITISTYVTGRDQLPSRELFNISIKDTGPGIDDAFKEKIFQPFQTTKDEGTGLGLYTCYGLMKSLGGGIKLNSTNRGTEVILSLPYSFDDEED